MCSGLQQENSSKKLSSLKFENETCAHFERKMASSPARKQLNVHCSMIRDHLSNLKFRNDICVHHFKSEVTSLLASKHLKLKLGITCQIFATFETTNASENLLSLQVVLHRSRSANSFTRSRGWQWRTFP